MEFLLSNINDFDFCSGLVVLGFSLYANVIHGEYVWDDRAAIVDNRDVHGDDSILNIFSNDFWGQDMKLHDSHKSYRPITVLTYRMSHAMGGLHPWSFHIGNIIIYCLAVVTMYNFANQWMNRRGARVASLLFCFHPIHVEAVASIVGRADALCGLLVLCACILYTTHSRSGRITININTSGIGKNSKDNNNNNNHNNSNNNNNNGGKIVNPYRNVNEVSDSNNSLGYIGSSLCFLSSLVMCIAASLAKEVGVTVFGVLILLEFADTARFIQLDALQRSKRLSLTDDQRMSSLAGGIQYTLSSPWSMLRIILILVTFALFMWFRLYIHGEHTMYQWTNLENHVHHLPTFLERTLSYGQSHFWYFAKLVFPRHLCFDYGLACIPTIASIADWRNIFPIISYSGVALLLGQALMKMRISLLVGFAMLLLPLFPALNIVFPVGTLLAERLLFVPSIGFCLIVGELVTVDLTAIWVNIAGELNATLESGAISVLLKPLFSSSSSNNNNNNNNNSNNSKRDPPGSGVRNAFLFLLLCLYSIRVVTRNQDWLKEVTVYETALDVCPLSVKANNNVGMFRLGRGDYYGAIEVLDRTLTIFNNQVSAHINIGLAYMKVQDYVTSASHYERAMLLAPNNPKVHGYHGMVLSEWSKSLSSDDAAMVPILQEQARTSLDRAMNLGWKAPTLLYHRSLLAIESKDYKFAIPLLLRAAEQTERARSNPHLPSQDNVNLPTTYNLLGLSYGLMGEDNTQNNSNNPDAGEAQVMAEQMYLKGLSIAIEDNKRRNDNTSGSPCDLVNNLGMMYRSQGRYQEAREVMSQCVPTIETISATLNNLGMLELDANEPRAAADYFKRAIEEMKKQKREHDDNFEVMKNNLARAQAIL